MEKIIFDDSTYLWKTKLNLLNFIDEITKEALKIIQPNKFTKYDAYGYFEEWKGNDNFIGEMVIKNKLDLICQMGINYCIKLWELEYNEQYNKVNTDAWVNVLKSKNPSQPELLNGNIQYHTHTEKLKESGKFIPHYTYVYYIQMPDIMENEDGVLYIKGLNDINFFLRPEVDDLIILPADLPHAPNNSAKAIKDRIVIAGNVGFEYRKKEQTLL